MRRINLTLSSLILAVSLLTVLLFQAAAASPAQAAQGDWLEQDTKSFAIIYPTEYAVLGQVLLTSYGDILDSEYARFAAAFGVDLSLPVTIRIYPEEADYYHLNVVAPKLGPGASHSHIGAHEIALIGRNITNDLPRWQIEGLNAFRYELAALFTCQITNNKAPPGLLAGIGLYAEDPKETLGVLDSSGGLPGNIKLKDIQLNQAWDILWTNPDVNLNLLQLFQANSTVAYLVDAYGWSTLLQLLKSLPTASSYTTALEATYQTPFTSLEKGWQAYFPLFTSGRWQYDVLYNDDLSRFEKLIQAGGYSSALPGLNETVQFLEKLKNQPAALDRARKLLETAKLGQSAATLALQSRQALQNADYAGSIALVEQAEQKYTQLGDTSRMDELEAYRDRATEILDLHQKANQLYNGLSVLDTDLSPVIQLGQMAQRLGALGDSAGQKQIENTLGSFETSREQFKWKLSLGAVLLAGVLLLGRIFLMRRAPSLEAQL